MKGIELEIFYNTEQTATLDDMGIKTSVDDCQVRKVIFYNINAISCYEDGGNKYCCIHCNGTEFISTSTFESVKRLLQNQ